MGTRPYKVTTPSGIKVVEAATKSQAINKVMDGEYKAEAMSTHDLMTFIKEGGEILYAADQSVQEEAETVEPEVVEADDTVQSVEPETEE